MSKWIFLTLVLGLGIKDINGGVPLMAVAPMVSAARGFIGTITNAIAPGHNEIKDAFALNNDSLISIQKINQYISSHKELINETLITVKSTENNLANVNIRIYEIDDIAKKVLNNTEMTNFNLNKVLIKAQYVVTELPKISAQIDKKLTTMMDNLAERLETDEAFRIDSKTLAEKIGHIQNKYEEFLLYLNPQVPYTPMSYESLFNATLSDGAEGIIDDIAQIEALLTASNGDKVNLYKGFLNSFNRKGKLMSYSEKCGLGDTYQNRLKTIYNLVSINEYRALVMLVISHKYFEVQKDKSARGDINRIYNEYINRTTNHLTAMKAAMALASTEIIQCDPPQYLLDINTFSMTNLFSMIYFSTDQIGNRCSKSCKKIDTVNKLACKTDVKNRDALTVPEYCPKKQCNGRIHNCEIKNYNEFCEAREGAGARYHWVDNAVDNSMRMNCDGRWVDTMTQSKCMECWCECSAEGAESTATRTISLIPQYADVKNNMVVSNVRLRKKDNVVHIQIEQALLLPGGEIDTRTRQWVPLDNLVYRQNVPEGAFWKVQGKEQVGLVFNEHYTFLNSNKKTLYLDDIVVNKGYIVTGVRFRNSLENSEQGTPNLSPIQLEIYKTKFDYQKGVLSSKIDEQHISVVANNVTQSHNNRYHHARGVRVLGNLRISTDSNRNLDVSESNQQIDFRLTGKASLGKAVIPFFDARPATEESQVPLSGIGIVHRKRNTYGGFISPRLIGMDHSKYVVTKLTEDERRFYENAFMRENEGSFGEIVNKFEATSIEQRENLNEDDFED